MLRTSSNIFILQIGVAFWRVVLREIYFEGPNRIWRGLKTSLSLSLSKTKYTNQCRPRAKFESGWAAHSIPICRSLDSNAISVEDPFSKFRDLGLLWPKVERPSVSTTQIATNQDFGLSTLRTRGQSQKAVAIWNVYMAVHGMTKVTDSRKEVWVRWEWKPELWSRGCRYFCHKIIKHWQDLGR